MDQELCSITLKISLQMHFSGEFAFRRILPKVQQKNWGVSPGVYANENGAV